MKTAEDFLTNSSWRLREIAIKVIAFSLKRHWYLIKDYKISLIIFYDTEIKVRSVASGLLQTIVPLMPSNQLQDMIKEFKGKIEANKDDINTFHGAILGLMGITNVYMKEIPDWIPELLCYLAKYKNGPGIVSESVKNSNANFWRFHKPTWEYVKGKFSEEQQEELSDHVKSYYYFA